MTTQIKLTIDYGPGTAPGVIIVNEGNSIAPSTVASAVTFTVEVVED
jgi:hypothetical protein